MKVSLPTVLASAAAAGAVVLGASVVPSGVSPDAAPESVRTLPAGTTPAKAIPASESQGLVLHTVPSCRVVATGKGTGANAKPLAKNEQRTYYVGGTAGYAAQGGAAGGCGVPEHASAVVATVTMPSPTASGSLRTWPVGTTEPTGRTASYTKGQTSSVGTTLTIAPGAGKALAVRSVTGATGLVVDVTGYYTEQPQGQVEPNGVLLDSSRTLVSSSKIATGTYRLDAAFPITACSIQAQSTVFSYYTSVGTVSGTTFDIYVWRINSGVNTLTDGRFLVSITC